MRVAKIGTTRTVCALLAADGVALGVNFKLIHRRKAIRRLRGFTQI
jgi:hypothetical protein